MALERFKAAPLPNPPAQYDPQYVRQLIRVIEIYFSQLDSITPNQASSYRADNFYGGDFYGGKFNGDGSGLRLPHNQFYSSVDQTIAAIDQAYAVRLEHTNFTDGISITGVNNTQITFSEPGIYRLDYSLSFKNPTNDAQFVDIWLRYEGVNVANSNSKFTIPPRKSTGDPAFLIAVTPLGVEALAAGDYVEIMWTASSTSVVMEHLPAVAYSAGVTPAIPATPSAIVEAMFLSAPSA